MDWIRDVWTDRSIKAIEHILWEWINVLERFTREWKSEDFPWWYNERACIGMLSGAIWRSGGAPLEEYVSEKVKDRSEFGGTNMSNRARTDLYFSYRDKEYIAEAKQWWPDLEVHETHVTGLAESLRNAENDAHAVNEECNVRLSVVFAIPKAAHAALGNLSGLVKDWRDRIDADANDYSARALYFPEVGSQARDEYWIYPGIGIFLKVVC